MRRFVVPLLLPVIVAASGCATMGVRKIEGAVTATERTPREIYEHGTRMMEKGFFDRAEKDFQELRNFHRDDPLSVKAQLALAEIDFKQGEFEEARYAYEEFATYHPRHEDLDFVTWRIGYCIWRRAPKVAGRDQSTTRAAVNRWDGFATRFPDSEHIPDVDKLHRKGLDRLAAKELFVARFYATRKAWLAVAGRARGVLRRFPGSKHDELALAMLAESLHKVGQVDEARMARDRLAADHPESSRLASVDKVLAGEPGTPPDEEVFVRPYRVPGMNQGPMGGPPR